MAAVDSRTLEIVARVRDLASRQFLSIVRTITGSVRGALTGAFRAVGSVLRGLRSAFSAFGAAALAAFGAMRGAQGAKQVLEAAEAMLHLSRATRTTVEDLSALRVAFDLGGLPVDRFEGMVRELQTMRTRVLTGAPRTERPKAGLAEIGISVADLRRLSAPQLLEKMAAGLSRFSSEQARANALAKIFPESYQVLLPLLAEGADALRQNVALAREFGAVLSREAAQAANDFNDAWTLFTTVLGSAARDAIIDLARELTPLVRGMAEFVRQNKDELAASIKSVIALLGDLALKLAELLVRLLFFLSEGGAGFLEWLRKIPVVGGAAADAVEQIFGKTTAQARAVREEIKKTVAALLASEDRVRQLERAAADPGREFAGAPADERRRLAEEAGRSFAAQLDRERAASAALREELNELAAAFDAANEGRDTFAAPPEGQPLGGEARRQVDLARVQRMSELLFSGMLGPGAGRGVAKGAGEGTPADEIDDTAAAAEEFFAGFSAGVAKALDDWRSFGAAAAEAGRILVSQGLEGITDAFAAIILGTKSVKEAFRDMARAMLEEIARLIPRLLIVRLLSGFLAGLGGAAPGGTPSTDPDFVRNVGGLARGGVVPGGVVRTMPLRRFQHGGVAREPTLAVFGEAGDEAFIPLQAGRVPVQLRGAGGNTVVVNITAMDSQDVRRALARERHFLSDLWRAGARGHDARATREVIREVG